MYPDTVTAPTNSVAGALTTLVSSSRVTPTSAFTVNSSGVLTGYSGTYANVVIPEYVPLNGVNVAVTSIGANAMSSKSFKSVTIGGHIKYLANNAFYGCTNLTTITMGNSTEVNPSPLTMGNNVFYGCTALTSVTISSNVPTSLGLSMFGECTNLTDMTIGANVTSIGQSAFNSFGITTKLANLTIEDGSRPLVIEINAFRGNTSLTHVTLPNRVTSITVGAFVDCGFTSGLPPAVTIQNKSNAVNIISIFGATSHVSVNSSNIGQDARIFTNKNNQSAAVNIQFTQIN